MRFEQVAAVAADAARVERRKVGVREVRTLPIPIRDAMSRQSSRMDDGTLARSQARACSK